MSFYTYYQAIPERGRLLDRLRSQKEFCILYTWLIVYGSGPFHLEKLDPDELDEILDDFAENAIFGSRAKVNRGLDDLRTELAYALTLYPGLDNRLSYIEKQHRAIEGPLSEEVRRRGSEADVKVMRELLYGANALAPEFFDEYDSQLYLVRASTVTEGARILKAAELSVWDDELCGSAMEQYRHWKGFVIGAADLGEAALVFPTG